jgi:hypothetical protein
VHGVAVARPSEELTRRQLAEAVDAVDGEPASAMLAELLYARWYARPRWPVEVPRHWPPELVEVLRAAHAGSPRWEDGWRAERVGPRGQVVARRDAAVRLLERSDYTPVRRPGLLPRPGDELSITGRRDVADRADGWWRTCGRSWSWTVAPAGLVRLYWVVRLAGLPDLVHRLTSLLADEAEPWLLKCACDVDVYARADAVVLYLTADVVGRRAGALVDTALALGADARHGGPPLTLPVAPGLAAALDPGGDESFGSHRCRLVAEGIAAHASGGAAVDAVVARLGRAGVDVSRPWARGSDPLLPWER